MSESIHMATTASDYEAFAELVREYVGWSRERYKEDAWFVDQVFGHQSLETELHGLSLAYGPPQGKTLLAVRDGQVCGAGAYRRLEDGSCEMKRLFVPARFQGHGTGRTLCEALIACAKDDGFRLMRLDTGKRLTEAITMYKTIGFRDCAAHHTYPDTLVPYLVFMEMPLTEH